MSMICIDNVCGGTLLQIWTSEGRSQPWPYGVDWFMDTYTMPHWVREARRQQQQQQQEEAAGSSSSSSGSSGGANS
jgi:hypothetical protein